MKTEEKGIHDLHARWIAAVNAADLAVLLPLMTDDVVFFSPGQAPFGRDKFCQHFLAAHKEALVHCVSELEEVVVVGEVAYTRSRDAVSVTQHSGGEAMQFAGYRMTVYRHQSDGRWLLARDVHTVSPVQR